MTSYLTQRPLAREIRPGRRCYDPGVTLSSPTSISARQVEVPPHSRAPAFFTLAASGPWITTAVTLRCCPGFTLTAGCFSFDASSVTFDFLAISELLFDSD